MDNRSGPYGDIPTRPLGDYDQTRRKVTEAIMKLSKLKS